MGDGTRLVRGTLSDRALLNLRGLGLSGKLGMLMVMICVLTMRQNRPVSDDSRVKLLFAHVRYPRLNVLME